MFLYEKVTPTFHFLDLNSSNDCAAIEDSRSRHRDWIWEDEVEIQSNLAGIEAWICSYVIISDNAGFRRKIKCHLTAFIVILTQFYMHQYLRAQ